MREAADIARSETRRARRGPQWQPVAVALTGLAVFLSVLVLGHEESHGLAILLAWALLAAGLGSLHRFVAPLRPLFLDFLALAVIGVTLIGWLAYFVGFGWERFSDPACLHRGLLFAALLAAEIRWLVHVVRPLWTGPSRAVTLVGLGLLMLGVGVVYSRLSKRET